MSSTLRPVSLQTVLVAATIAMAACGGSGTKTDTTPTANVTADGKTAITALEMTIKGGFAYVYENEQLEIGFLNRSAYACDSTVTATTTVGTVLRVTGGTITSSNPPPTKEFDLQGTVVTFPGMNANGIVTALGVGRPNAPFKPATPSVEANWRDLKWVPYLRPNYPGSINANWRTLSVVDGRVVLTDGTIKGGKPSDIGATNGVYRFRRASDSMTFDQAITDRTLYNGRLPGTQIVINLTKGSATTQVVVVPPSAGQPVSLVLEGKHDSGPAMATITHLCGLYELFDPVPPVNQRLIPTLLSSVTGLPCAVTGTGGCNPGAYCPGEWF
jgi:hypothetical protein